MKVYCYNIKDFSKANLEGKLIQLGIGREELSRYKNKEDQKRKLIGELLIREMIQDESDLESDQIRITRTSSGKPVLQDSDLYFNISHSGDMVYGVIDDHLVGIDVEKIRPVRASVLRYICTDEELKEFTSGQVNPTIIDDEDNLNRFFSLWTKKEAYIKCLGLTLKEMRNLEIDEDNYDFFQKEEDGYVITVCSKTQ